MAPSLEDTFGNPSDARVSVVPLSGNSAYSAGDVMSYGSFAGTHAWSTIKVPMSQAILDNNQSYQSSAITESNNEAAANMWGQLGGGDTAAGKLETVLGANGNWDVVVNPTQNRPDNRDLSAYGQTDWSTEDQAVFMANYYKSNPNSQVITDMQGGESGETGYGLALVFGADNADNVKVKGGWGPEADGTYTYRQMGIVKDANGNEYAVSLIATGGSKEEARANLTAKAEELRDGIATSRREPVPAAPPAIVEHTAGEHSPSTQSLKDPSEERKKEIEQGARSITVGDKEYKVPFISSNFDPSKPISQQELVTAARENGIEIGNYVDTTYSYLDALMPSLAGAMYAYLPPNFSDTFWLPFIKEVSASDIPDSVKELMKSSSANSGDSPIDELVENYIANVKQVKKGIETADSTGFAPKNLENITVEPQEGWFYPSAQISPKNSDTSYSGGSNINTLMGSHKALMDLNKVVTNELADAVAYMESMATDDEQLVNNMGNSEFFTAAVKKTKEFISPEGKNSMIERTAVIMHDAGVFGNEQWHGNFRGPERDARDKFAALFSASCGNLPTTYVMLPFTHRLSDADTSFSPPNLNLDMMTTHGKSISGIAPDKLSVMGNSFIDTPEKKTPPKAPNSNPSAPFSPSNRTPGSPSNANPNGTPKENKKGDNLDKILPLLAALGQQQPQQQQPQQQMPTSSQGTPMGQTPGAADPVNNLSGNPKGEPKGLDEMLRKLDEREDSPPIQPVSQTMPVSSVGAGTPKSGDPVRPNQLGADGKKLDKDGDGLMDLDAVAQTKENTQPVPVPLRANGEEYNPVVPDPRLGEMMHNLAEGNPDGSPMRILDAAALSGMEMDGYGKYLDDPLSIRPGDLLVGDQTGMYLGEGNVLCENGDVVPLQDVLQIEPPDKGVFRLDLPELPTDAMGSHSESGAPVVTLSDNPSPPPMGQADEYPPPPPPLPDREGPSATDATHYGDIPPAAAVVPPPRVEPPPEPEKTEPPVNPFLAGAQASADALPQESAYQEDFFGS